MKILLALVIGAAVGAAAFWLFTSERGRSTVQSTATQLDSATRTTRDAVQSQLESMNLRSEDIKKDLAKTGRVVRRKAQEAGQVILDATADARTTASIKTRLLAHPDLSAMHISVNTTAGVVTLSGAVSSMEQISKTMLLAMETDGVREVISTLQVNAGKPIVQIVTNLPAAPKK
jgi:gas vesicle protein